MNENYTVNSLEEMPKALSYLIEKVDSLQKTVNTLRNKQQVSESPRWMNIDELCAYHPSHPKKQTVYEWVSKKTIPYHKMTKGLMFLLSEIDEWLKSGAQKTEEDAEVESIIAEIEARGIDIAPEYGTWVNSGFALADGLGEGVRNFFHRMSRLHSDYDYSITDRQFTFPFVEEYAMFLLRMTSVVQSTLFSKP